MAEMRGARMVSAYSSTADKASVFEVSAMVMIGTSAGFDLPTEGGCMSEGSSGCTFAIAAWTSWAAASMLRSSLKVMLIVTAPWALVEVIASKPAIVVNCFSSGVATADAMVSGLAPGKPALTEMDGYSTGGRSLTGSL